MVSRRDELKCFVCGESVSKVYQKPDVGKPWAPVMTSVMLSDAVR